MFDFFDGDVDVDDAAVGFGIGEEIGRENAEEEEKARKASKDSFEIDPDEGFNIEEKDVEIRPGENERPEGAISLKARVKSGLPKFEQWVRDVISGKKTLDDEL